MKAPAGPRAQILVVVAQVPDQVGNLASLLSALADTGISVLGGSTYETDFILIPAQRLTDAREALENAGHYVEAPDTPR